jgi:NAD(P)-dependent dehydrogenase (short-subunit alcohol dehydrogenase family)
MSMRFAGKTTVITGAASGIGKATVLKFAAEGAIVYAADIDEAGGAALVAGSNGDVRFVRCDVCHVPDIRALMDRAANETGGIDIVFNNAAAVGDRAPIDEIDAGGWDATMNLILRSVAMGIRYAAPHMKGRAGASIINTASIAGLGAGYSPTAYAVAKAGVVQLSKLAATDLAQYGIRVNAVCPGFINTNIFTAEMDLPDTAKMEAKGVIAAMSAQAQPVARGGQGEDIANMVAFLASSEASFITGTHMVVDGGITTGPRHAWDPQTPSMFAALLAMEEAAKAASAA